MAGQTSGALAYLAVLALLLAAYVPLAESHSLLDKFFQNYVHPTCPSSADSDDPCGNSVFVKKGCKVQVEILKNEAAYTDLIYTCKKTRDGLKPDQYIGAASETGKKVQVTVSGAGELIFCINALYPPLGVDDWFYAGCASRNFDGGVHAATFSAADYNATTGGRRALQTFLPLFDHRDDDDNYCSRSLVVAFEDRRANENDRPQIPTNPKDFNDAVVKVTGCIKCYTPTCAFDGYKDCDNTDWNGAETDVTDDHDNCGWCGRECKADQFCVQGSCRKAGK